MEEQPDLHSFLYQKQTYRGKFSLKALVFNANLQEFAARVTYICNLQTLGKLSAEDSYQQINALWEQLERSYLEPGIDSSAEEQ